MTCVKYLRSVRGRRQHPVHVTMTARCVSHCFKVDKPRVERCVTGSCATQMSCEQFTNAGVGSGMKMSHHVTSSVRLSRMPMPPSAGRWPIGDLVDALWIIISKCDSGVELFPPPPGNIREHLELFPVVNTGFEGGVGCCRSPHSARDAPTPHPQLRTISGAQTEKL